MVKTITFIKRKPGMNLDDFGQYWRTQHAGIVTKLPGLRRYVQCHTIPSGYRNGEPTQLDVFDNRVEKWRDPSHGRSCTPEEWQVFFQKAGLTIVHQEFFRKSHDYADWTARAQVPAHEKAQLQRFILESDQHIQRYFEVKRAADGQLESFTNDFIFLIGRKG